MSKFGGVLALCMIAVAIVVFLTFGEAAIGAVDENANVTNTTYADAYNGTVDVSKLTFNTFPFIAFFLIIGAAFGAVMLALRM